MANVAGIAGVITLAFDPLITNGPAFLLFDVAILTALVCSVLAVLTGNRPIRHVWGGQIKLRFLSSASARANSRRRRKRAR
jgi:hypothetical protein